MNSVRGHPGRAPLSETRRVHKTAREQSSSRGPTSGPPRAWHRDRRRKSRCARASGGTSRWCCCPPGRTCRGRGSRRRRCRRGMNNAPGGDGEGAHHLPRGRGGHRGAPALPTRSHPGRPRRSETCSFVSNRPDRAWRPEPKASLVPHHLQVQVDAEEEEEEGEGGEELHLSLADLDGEDDGEPRLAPPGRGGAKARWGRAGAMSIGSDPSSAILG